MIAEKLRALAKRFTTTTFPVDVLSAEISLLADAVERDEAAIDARCQANDERTSEARDTAALLAEELETTREQLEGARAQLAQAQASDAGNKDEIDNLRRQLADANKGTQIDERH